MTVYKFIFLALLTIFTGLLNSCTSTPIEKICLTNLDSTITPIKVDIKTLSKDYKLFQGKYIETTGEFYQAFEQFAIYTPKLLFGERKGFWLEIDADLADDSMFFAKADGNKVTIKGIVDTSSKGHLSGYLATIRRVYCWQRH